ncbi:MAG TPA: glycosyltransferase family 4 protein, partial [Planctomycetota bacterium]|nr:glycosyltransferase family 4 protein [Planctomycetota bacterium]
MRLLFVNQKLSFAGTSSYTLDLAMALRCMGDEVRICTTGGDLRRAFTDAGIETYLVKFNFFSFRKLLEFLKEYRPHLLHIQNQRSATFGQKLSQKLDLPHIVTVHRSPDISSPRLLHSNLVGVIAANEVIRAALVNNQGIPKSLVRVVERGVNTEVLTPGRSVEPGTPASAAENRLIPVVGSVGSITRVKGHHVFLEAARRVLDRGVEAMFAIVGEGEDEPYLRKLVRELRLEPHVTFSAHIPDRRELFRTFDIVVVPTLRGGVGSTALEAMSVGKPVIASAVGEILHIIEDGKTGILVPEGDKESLAEKIAELIANPGLCRTLGSNARAYVVDHFALAPMVKATREFYEDVESRISERS